MTSWSNLDFGTLFSLLSAPVPNELQSRAGVPASRGVISIPGPPPTGYYRSPQLSEGMLLDMGTDCLSSGGGNSLK